MIGRKISIIYKVYILVVSLKSKAKIDKIVFLHKSHHHMLVNS